MATSSPGDKIFVPPMNPDHKGDPVNYTLETCPLAKMQSSESTLLKKLNA